MKYTCPFCNHLMSYSSEKQYFYYSNIESTADYLIHKCRKSKCKIGTLSKFKIWEYQDQVQGASIIFSDCLSKYKLVSRYDLNLTSFSEVKEELGFNFTTNCSLKKIIEINVSTNIDLNDPINSGQKSFNRLKKLLVFS